MSDDQPPEDDRPPGEDRPDESNADDHENRPDDGSDESTDDSDEAVDGANEPATGSDEPTDGSPEATDGEPSESNTRQPPIGPGSTDRWSTEESPESGDSDGGHWLSSLLNLLDSLDRSSRASRSGRTGGGGRFGLDYDVSIGSGLESIDSDSVRGSPDRGSRDSRGINSGRSSSSSPPSRTRRRRSSMSTQHVTTRTYDDELLVIADVSAVDPDSITVGFDDEGTGETTLVVGVGDRELERVVVPWDRSSVEAEARIKNGVLTVTVSTEDLGSGGDVSGESGGEYAGNDQEGDAADNADDATDNADGAAGDPGGGQDE